MYAVIDLETTGLDPARHDRIVEIAIVHVDASGAITREWCTLINPQRDIGPQRIHGIRSADARRAPTFAEAAGQIVELLRGRVLVAHNVAFDGPFLAYQFRAHGHETPISLERTLCTMKLAADYLPGSGRALAACCATAGVPLEHAHCALDDARAAALLLGHYLSAAGDPPPWAAQIEAAASADWPALPVRHTAEVRRRADDEPEPHFLSRLVELLPRVAEPPNADAYLAVLDQALVDRYVSATESDALVATARELRLARSDVALLHEGYLAELATAALADGVVSDAERADLEAVATLLALPDGSVDAALARAAAGRVPRQRTRFHLSPGDEVVFTGDTALPREVWEARARAAGLLVHHSVTRATRLLVAADVDTMSGKARKAREYGVPVVHLATFATMVEGLTEMAP